MDQLLTVSFNQPPPRMIDSAESMLISHYLQDFSRSDIHGNRVYAKRILMASRAVRANLVCKWENSGDGYHLALHTPTVALCPLEGKHVGQLESIGLRQFLKLVKHSHAGFTDRCAKTL